MAKRLLYRISYIILFVFLIGCVAEQKEVAPENIITEVDPMVENIKWLGHASFKITGEKVIYIDPWKINQDEKADIILISHSHYDHLSAEDVEKIKKNDTIIITTEDSIGQLHGDVRVLFPGDTINIDGILIEGVPSYNPNKKFHPRENNWLGFVVNVNGKKIYYAGDTDVTDEMLALKDIDIALMPVGGTYTMDAGEAASAVNKFRPKLAIPYHFGDIVGKKEDAEKFKELSEVDVEILG